MILSNLGFYLIRHCQQCSGVQACITDYDEYDVCVFGHFQILVDFKESEYSSLQDSDKFFRAYLLATHRDRSFYTLAIQWLLDPGEGSAMYFWLAPGCSVPIEITCADISFKPNFRTDLNLCDRSHSITQDGSKRFGFMFSLHRLFIYMTIPCQQVTVSQFAIITPAFMHIEIMPNHDARIAIEQRRSSGQ